MSSPPDRASYPRARVAALLAEFPDGGPELCGAIVDLFDETINEVVADVYRERDPPAPFHLSRENTHPNPQP